MNSRSNRTKRTRALVLARKDENGRRSLIYSFSKYINLSFSTVHNADSSNSSDDPGDVPTGSSEDIIDSEIETVPNRQFPRNRHDSSQPKLVFRRILITLLSQKGT